MNEIVIKLLKMKGLHRICFKLKIHFFFNSIQNCNFLSAFRVQQIAYRPTERILCLLSRDEIFLHFYSLLKGLLALYGWITSQYEGGIGVTELRPMSVLFEYLNLSFSGRLLKSILRCGFRYAFFRKIWYPEFLGHAPFGSLSTTSTSLLNWLSEIVFNSQGRNICNSYII